MQKGKILSSISIVISFLTILFSSNIVYSKEFSLFGVTLNSTVEDIINLAKEKNYSIEAIGGIQTEYSLKNALIHTDAFEHLKGFLWLDPKFDNVLINKLIEADRIFKGDRPDSNSFMNDVYECILLTIEVDPNPDHPDYRNIVLYCNFVKINGTRKMLDIFTITPNKKLLKTINEVFHEKYGNPTKVIPVNDPASGREFDSSKPINSTDDNIWEDGNEICMFSMKYTGYSGFINIYNKATMNETINLIEGRADKIIQDKQNVIDSKNKAKTDQWRSNI